MPELTNSNTDVQRLISADVAFKEFAAGFKRSNRSRPYDHEGNKCTLTIFKRFFSLDTNSAAAMRYQHERRTNESYG